MFLIKRTAFVLLACSFAVPSAYSQDWQPNSVEVRAGASEAEIAAFVSTIKQHGGRVMVRIKSPDVSESQILDLSSQSPSDLLDRLKSRKERVRARRDRIRSGLERRGHRLGDVIDLVPLVVSRLQRASEQELRVEVKGFLAQSDVEAIEADLPVEIPADQAASSAALETADGALAQSVPWGITRVKAPEAWVLTPTRIKGAGVKVAVLDSGGTPGHPDLNYVGGYGPLATGDKTAPDAWSDSIGACNGHGTHIAGTIAALDNADGVVGVAPEAQLYAIRVFQLLNGSCLAYSSTQINGINWAVTQGIRVINVSIGSSFSAGYRAAIEQARLAGTYVVGAAGNDGGSVLRYPAGEPAAIGVGALNGSNTKSSYSNTGADLDIAAPGDGIPSTMPSGGYANKSGTSMATPHVVGVVALMLQARSSLTHTQILDIFASTSTDLGTPGKDDSYGYGLVNAEAAVAMALGGAPPVVEPTLAEAENDLLLSSGITASQRALLDQRGNNNGVFDLGDVLAKKNRG